MEKRVVIFLVLSLAIILGYDYLLRELGLTPPTPTEQSTSTDSSDFEVDPQAPSAPEAPAAPSLKESAADPGVGGTARLQTTAPGTTRAVEDGREEVSTGLYRAVFSRRGAEIRSWELQRYTTGDEESRQAIDLTFQEGRFPRPLSIQGTDASVNKAVAEGLYQVTRDFTVLDADHPTGHLTFLYRSPDGAVRVEKQLTFHYDSYLVEVRVDTTGVPGPVQVNLGTNFGIVEWGEGFIGLMGPATMIDGHIEKDMPDGETVRTGDVRWVAIQDKYFLTVLIPQDGAAAVLKKEGDKLVSAATRFTGSSGSLQLYAGPKEYDTLKALSLGLEDTIDFGWFIYGSWGIVKAVAKPLFYVLRFLYDFTHNYGVAIVLLTVGIKLLFVPLQYKSYKSMKDMQLIQPKVVALQAKYKDDRERLNRELIKLYRDHKVNPVGGCLPMLLQMPVFVALFNILYMTIDLRQAPFLLWITDLSVQDPYYVLPILMGVSMVVQQKIMPSTMDPMQAKIMLLLPAFMTILFLSFPAGLVLYWLTNNVLTITQQYVTDRYIFKRPTFTSPVASAEAPAVGTGAPDGQKSGKKKKERPATKSEADRNAPIES